METLLTPTPTVTFILTFIQCLLLLLVGVIVYIQLRKAKEQTAYWYIKQGAAKKAYYKRA